MSKEKPIIIMLPPEKLTPYANNAKTHSTEQVDKVAGQISKFGFDQPILVDKEYVIIKGHCRREAALRLQLKEIPVIVADHLSDYEAMAARIADNKVATLGEIDNEKLSFDLGTLERNGFNLEDTAYEITEISNILSMGELGAVTDASDEWKGMPEFNQEDKTAFRHIVVHFADAENVANFFTLIGQKDTGITKTVWLPPQENMDTGSKSYDE